MGKFSRLAVFPAMLMASASAAAASGPAKPLFAGHDVVRLTIKGPVAALARGSKSREPRPATLTLAGAAPETHAILLSPRGITRLKRDVCQFPPLRVTLSNPPAAASLFSGQRSLKLVTHCRAGEGFQQHLLLEYAAYRLYNQLTPASFGARLALIDYVDDSGKPVTSRFGFFIEDVDDVAARNGVRKANVGTSIPASQLSRPDAARFALFEYLIGNLDWSMRAGPPGDSCCHNGRLIPAASGRGLAPVPYDFDFSGLVDAPYATPPAQVPVRTVRSRYYRGYCFLNSDALASAADYRAKRAALLGVFDKIPQLDERTRRKAVAFIDAGLADFADNQTVSTRILKTCVN